MITSLSAKQLATILDIKEKDAAKKLVFAVKGNKEKWQHIDEVEPPESVSIERLSYSLNIPNLQEMVNDIHLNFFKRPATRKFILEYPIKVYEEKKRKGVEKFTITVPAKYRRLLHEDVIKQINDKWKEVWPQLNKYFI